MARKRRSLPRSAALIALAALGLHQLRYWLAFGSDASHELAHDGHAYLVQALPIATGFAVAALVAGVLRAAFRRERERSPLASSLGARALLYAVGIFLVFSTQELLEGALSAGHAAGVDAVFAAGGWIALPLSALAGGLTALLDGGLVALGSLLATRLDRVAKPRAPRRSGAPRPAASPALTGLPLAFGLARRPPPLAR